MRNIVSICISLFIAGILANTAQGAQFGLAGAWLFDEGSGKTVKDSVGGDNGEVMGSLKWATTGKFGGALEFPGKGDSYVTIPHKPVLDSDPYTFTAWTKLEEASWQYIAWKDGLVWPEQHLKRHIDIWVHDADYVVLMWYLEGGGEGRADGKTIVADGKWHHVAEWCDSKTIRLYIDGKVDAESPVGGKLVVNGEDPLWIGARPGEVAAKGLIDEVGFFTKALSEDEFKAVMDQGLGVLASVEQSGKLSTTWGDLKVK